MFQVSRNKKRDTSFFKSWKLPKIGRSRNVPGVGSGAVVILKSRSGDDTNNIEGSSFPENAMSTLPQFADQVKTSKLKIP